MRSIGSFRLDPSALTLHRGAGIVPAARKTLELLAALSERPGEMISREELHARLWPEGFVEERNLAQQVYVLRKVLVADPSVFIENVPRRGYRLVCPSLAPLAEIKPLRAQPKPERQGPAWPVLRGTWRRRVALWPAIALIGAAVISAGGATVPAHPNVALPVAARRALELGRLQWEQRDDASLRLARDSFATAVRLAPQDARGYAGLALVDAIVGDHADKARMASAAYARAGREARAALARDPSNADAEAVIGLIEMFRGHAELANAAFANAQRNDPRHAYAHVWHGIGLLHAARISEARSELEAGVSLEPTSKIALLWLAEADYAARAYDAAESGAKAVLTVDGRMFDARWLRVSVAEVRQDYGGALRLARALPVPDEQSHRERDVLIARLEAETGNRPLGSRLFARVQRRGLNPLEVAITQIALGDRSAAVRTMRRISSLPSSDARGLRAKLLLDPRYAALRTLQNDDRAT